MIKVGIGRVIIYYSDLERAEKGDPINDYADAVGTNWVVPGTLGRVIALVVGWGVSQVNTRASARRWGRGGRGREQHVKGCGRTLSHGSHMQWLLSLPTPVAHESSSH